MALSPVLARPKSVTQTLPVVSRIRLPGLMSRWMIPRLWAYDRADAVCTPIWATLRK
jgi:hypothetical protein